MKSKAIFIGTNGSLGFVTGKEYDLYIFTKKRLYLDSGRINTLPLCYHESFTQKLEVCLLK